LKSNRIVKIEGRRMPLSGSVTVWGLNQNQKSSSSLCCFQAQIEGIGEVKIVVVDEGGGRVSYIVSRECIDGDEMVKLKKLRWQTEKLNDELKNMLGMDEYRVRKKEGIMRHCEIVMCVYTFLQYIRIELGLISRTPYQILEMIWESMRLVKIPDIILPLLGDKEEEKMELLIGIVYNIHVMIRNGNAERILFFKIRIFIIFIPFKISLRQSNFKIFF
jgi:hypothetical protein